MDIKRTQPGQTSWNRAADSDPAAKLDSARPDKAGDIDDFKGESGAMRAIGSEFKRADLNTDKWHTILNRSIDALLESTAQRTGALPGPARRQISDLLAADPIFSKRVFRYWEKNLN